MTDTSLDFSQRPDLVLHAEVVGEIVRVAEPLGITPLIVGAFARDLHLHYGHGIQTLRQTEDLDFAFALPSWRAFDAMQDRLINSADFSRSSTAAAHRLHHRNGMPVDLVPFGSVETRDRNLHAMLRGIEER